jgi:hypothetical protein
LTFESSEVRLLGPINFTASIATDLIFTGYVFWVLKFSDFCMPSEESRGDEVSGTANLTTQVFGIIRQTKNKKALKLVILCHLGSWCRRGKIDPPRTPVMPVITMQTSFLSKPDHKRAAFHIVYYRWYLHQLPVSEDAAIANEVLSLSIVELNFELL